MGSELVVRRWCDRCNASESPGFHAEVHLAIGEVDRIMDLCVPCFTEVVAPVIEQLGTLGQAAPKKPGRKPGKQPTKQPASQDAPPTLLGSDPDWRPMRGAGAANPANQQAVLEHYPDAPACPVCLQVFVPAEGRQGRTKRVAQHLIRHHQASITDFTTTELAEAQAKARDRLALLVA